MMKKRKLTRVYLPYYLWEETYTNMWGTVKDKKLYLKRAIDFTGNHVLYGKWMMRVVDEWHLSCIHNLSCRGMNRQAWIGHAACALAFNCPEDIVRHAWQYLSEEQQILANNEADKAIAVWEKRYLEEPWQSYLWE